MEYAILGVVIIAAFAVFKKQIGFKETIIFIAIMAMAVGLLHLAGLGVQALSLNYWLGYAAGVVIVALVFGGIIGLPDKGVLTRGGTTLPKAPASRRIFSVLGLLFFVVLFSLPFVLSLR